MSAGCILHITKVAIPDNSLNQLYEYSTLDKQYLLAVLSKLLYERCYSVDAQRTTC